MHDGLGQERMQMIIVDDFTVLYYTESRVDLWIDTPAGLGRPDGNRVCAVVPGKRVSLCRRDADFPILCKIYCFFSGRIFRDIALIATRRTSTYNFSSSSGKEG